MVLLGYLTPSSEPFGIMLLVKKLCDSATLPRRGSAEAAGYDLASAEDATIYPGKRHAVDTGLAIQVPAGTYGRVAPRSGLAVHHGIDVLAGVVDRDYTGPVKVVLQNHGDVPFVVRPSVRIAQLVLERIETPDVLQVSDLGPTTRGEGGFGSTGV